MCDNQSHYEINVSWGGAHFFATHPRSGINLEKIMEVHQNIVAKFPKSEGYDVTVTRWECSGSRVISWGTI